jgi:hypothetical protein
MAKQANPMQLAEKVELAELSIPPFQRQPKGIAERIAENFDPFLADPLKVGIITDIKSQPHWILDGVQRFTALSIMAQEDSISECFAYVQEMTRKEAYDYCLEANTQRIKFEMFDQFPILQAKGDKKARIIVAAAKDAGVTFLVREAKEDVPLVRSVSTAISWVDNVLPWSDNEPELITNGLTYGLKLSRAWKTESNRKSFPPAWVIEGAATLGLFYDGAADPEELAKHLPAWTSMKSVTGKGWKGRYEARAILIAETVNASQRGLVSKPKATIGLD